MYHAALRDVGMNTAFPGGVGVPVVSNHWPLNEWPETVVSLDLTGLPGATCQVDEEWSPGATGPWYVMNTFNAVGPVLFGPANLFALNGAVVPPAVLARGPLGFIRYTLTPGAVVHATAALRVQSRRI